jgi:HEAT repeat protein
MGVLAEYSTVDDYEEAVNPHALAEKTLVSIGQPAVERLIRAMDDERWGMRFGAMYCLGEIRDTRAIQPLIEILRVNDHPHNNVSWEVGEALGKIGEASVLPLIGALKHTNHLVRSGAILILGQFKDSRAVEPLLSILHDENADVRQSVIYALRKTAYTRSVEPIIGMLKDVDSEVREAAAGALGELGDKRAIEPLFAALEDSDCDVRQRTAEMLIKLNSPYEAKALELLTADLKNEDSDVRWGAVFSLNRLDKLDIVPLLLPMLDDEDIDVRFQASRGLVNRQHSQGIEVMIRYLDDDSIRRRIAAYELRDIEDERVVEAFKRLLNDPDKEMRFSAEAYVRQHGYGATDTDKPAS